MLFYNYNALLQPAGGILVRYILVCAWLAMLCSGLKAAEIKGLYRIETAVQSRDEATRTEDFRRALDQVLRRVVRTETLASNAVRNILAKPEAYVLQFEYATRAENGQTIPVLRVDFDPARLKDALRRGGIEAWGAERPEVLVWLAIQDSQQPQAVTADQKPEVDALLRELSDETGLPLTTPLWDLSDQHALTPADIATGNPERIRLASTRYETEVVLTGRLAQKADTTWEADWRLYRNDAQERWQNQTANLREILNSGLTGVYTRLAAQLIPRKAATTTLELKITGIASLDDANRVAAYLEKLSPVSKVEWLSIGAGDATFKVKLRGGRETFRQTVILGPLLRPATGEPGFSGLTYRLLR
jgi:hypothetical protein